MAEGKEESQREMEAFLEANPLPETKKKKRVRATTEMKQFKKLLNDPNAAWKEIDSGKGGAQ